MQLDFHYYATYCAAYLAGYSHEDSLSICQSAQFVDRCTATLLTKLKAPRAAATTQLPLEMMEHSSDRVGRENITRIWSSFHFLPYDLYAAKKRCGKRYLDKYRLICQPNSDLVVETVKLAKGGSLQAVGVAMHVLADTWAHRNFAGTPSLVINNTNYHFYELLTDGETVTSKVHVARHAPFTRRSSTLSPVPELLATPLAFDDTTSHETCAARFFVSSDSVFGSMQSSPPEYSSLRTTLSLPPTTPESRNVKFVQSAVAATEPADGPSTSHVSTSVPSHSGGSTFGLLAAIAARTKSAAKATKDNVRVMLISEPPVRSSEIGTPLDNTLSFIIPHGHPPLSNYLFTIP